MPEPTKISGIRPPQEFSVLPGGPAYYAAHNVNPWEWKKYGLAPPDPIYYPNEESLHQGWSGSPTPPPGQWLDFTGTGGNMLGTTGYHWDPSSGSYKIDTSGTMSDPSLNKTGQRGIQLPISGFSGFNNFEGSLLDPHPKPNPSPPQATPTGTGYSMQPQIPQNLTAPTSAFNQAYTPLSALTSSYQNRIGKAKGMNQWNPAYSSFWQNISYA